MKIPRDEQLCRALVWKCSCGRVMAYAGAEESPVKLQRVAVTGHCPACGKRIRRTFLLGNSERDSLARSMTALCGRKLISRTYARYSSTDGHHSPNRDYARWVIRQYITTGFHKPRTVQEIAKLLRYRGIFIEVKALQTIIDNAYPRYYSLREAPPWCSIMDVRRLRAYFGRSVMDRFFSAARKGEHINVLAAIIDERRSIARYIADYATGELKPKRRTAVRRTKLVNEHKKVREACMFCNIPECDRTGTLCIMRKAGMKTFVFVQSGVDNESEDDVEI